MYENKIISAKQIKKKKYDKSKKNRESLIKKIGFKDIQTIVRSYCTSICLEACFVLGV